MALFSPMGFVSGPILTATRLRENSFSPKSGTQHPGEFWLAELFLVPAPQPSGEVESAKGMNKMAKNGEEGAGLPED